MKISNKIQSKNGLNIIIVGCGKVGMTLIEQLSKEGHDITIIDKNAAKVQEMSNLYDIMGLVGNGASYSVQMEAGIENADLIIAVTASDELNLLCCTVAKQVGDCAAIARVRTPDYSKEAGYLREKLGLTMIINPELEASLETARILYLPTALEVNSFAHGQAEIVKFKIPEGNLLDGMTIATLGKSITNSISTVLMIGGFVVIFSSIISILKSSGILNSLVYIFTPLFDFMHIDTSFIYGILTGLLEITNGISIISNIHIKAISINIVLTAFLLGFGGLSVLLQVLSITSKTDLSIKPYFYGKLLHGFLAGFYTFIFMNFFPFFNFNL